MSTPTQDVLDPDIGLVATTEQTRVPLHWLTSPSARSTSVGLDSAAPDLRRTMPRRRRGAAQPVTRPVGDSFEELRSALATIADDPRLQSAFAEADRKNTFFQRTKASLSKRSTWLRMLPGLNLGMSAAAVRRERGRTRALKNLHDSHADPFVRHVADVLGRKHRLQRNLAIGETALATLATGLSAAGGAGALLSASIAVGGTGVAAQVATSAVDSVTNSGTGALTLRLIAKATERTNPPERHPLLPDHAEAAVREYIGRAPDAMQDPARLRVVLRYLGSPSATPQTLAAVGATLAHETARIQLKNRLGASASEDLRARGARRKARRGTAGLSHQDEFLNGDELSTWRNLKHTARRRDPDTHRIADLTQLESHDINALALLWKAESLFD